MHEAQGDLPKGLDARIVFGGEKRGIATSKSIRTGMAFVGGAVGEVLMAWLAW